MITPLTLTGCPESFVGENFDCSAACWAAERNNGCPLVGVAEITLPFSSIRTCTFTAPEAWALRAIAGYCGVTRRMALPFKTPPEIGACGVGFGVGGGGGGASVVSTLTGWPVPMPPVPPVPGAIGTAAFEFVQVGQITV